MLRRVVDFSLENQPLVHELAGEVDVDPVLEDDGNR